VSTLQSIGAVILFTAILTPPMLVFAFTGNLFWINSLSVRIAERHPKIEQYQIAIALTVIAAICVSLLTIFVDY